MDFPNDIKGCVEGGFYLGELGLFDDCANADEIMSVWLKSINELAGDGHKEGCYTYELALDAMRQGIVIALSKVSKENINLKEFNGDGWDAAYYLDLLPCVGWRE